MHEGSSFRSWKRGCPKFKGDAGVIVSRSGPSTIRVLFDGRRRPLTLHLSYVELPGLLPPE